MGPAVLLPLLLRDPRGSANPEPLVVETRFLKFVSAITEAAETKPFRSSSPAGPGFKFNSPK